MLLLKNGKTLINKSIEKCDMLIEDGIIKKIGDLQNLEVDNTIDLEGKFISPGFIDMHVHLREPGYEYKETIKSGTLSAAAGGYTLVCPMPNTNPIPNSVERIKTFLENVKTDAIVKVKPYASITMDLSGNAEVVNMKELNNLVCGFTNDGLGIQSSDKMYRAMQEAYLTESLIAAHCEDEELVYNGFVHEGRKSKKEGWKGIPSLSESLQVARDSLIAETTGARYHVCHISTKESVRIVRDAKARGVKITAEVTPHHLILTDTEVEDTNFKMNPPVRGLEDKFALIAALLDGTIDVIATDHAPHSEEEKNKSFEEAPFGIVGLETAFPLLYTNLVKTNIATLDQLLNWFSINPAKILNLPYGKIHEGRVADLTIIDLNKKKDINKAKFHSKGKNSPFDGWECYGWPVMTIVDGKIVFQDEEF